ncbi:MAG: lipase maturation factor family protein [Candidatus Eisenbacteria bacterium]|nr:lipase maturation factor family protein [Candidatus Eisenbacteria bacterium]
MSRAEERPARPLMIWDGECSFCRRWIERWRWALGDRVEFATYQRVAARFPAIPVEQFRAAVHLVEPDGRVSRGAEAVHRALSLAPGQGWRIMLYERVPGFARVSEAVYRFVAGHRPAFDRLTTWLWGPHVVPPGRRLTAWIFLRLVGVAYLIAFVSLWSQIDGLIGSRGILPAGLYLDAVREHLGPGLASFRFAPTLAWLGAGDSALHAMCAAGTIAAALVVAGIAAPLALAACWALYLSLVTVGQNFLWFQWDSLLLETGMLAIVLAPRRVWSRPGRDPEPPPLAVAVMLWLLFRLMVSSSAVKIASGDPTWRNLTALTYHYETQCLPAWPAWFMHHLSAGVQRFSVGAMFACEGAAPFLLLAPRRLRFAGIAAMIGLQLLIAATGNYGFFNVLAIALCLLALDDGVWPWRWPAARASRAAARAAPDGLPPATIRARHAPGALAIAAAAVYVALSLVPLLQVLQRPTAWMGPVAAIHAQLAGFRSVDRYGLFAVMTTRRNEIELEGSMDGVAWRPYAFRWKPGDLTRRPEFVAPHMPRLDWQMWFAALGDFRNETWFLPFCRRVLEGSPPVMRLMGPDPFAGIPPRYLRAVVYDYHFTDAATRRVTGAWWRRTPLGLYCPVLALEGGRLIAAPQPAPAR